MALGLKGVVANIYPTNVAMWQFFSTRNYCSVVHLVHGVVLGLGQVPHEPEDGDPQGQTGLKY